MKESFVYIFHVIHIFVVDNFFYIYLGIKFQELYLIQMASPINIISLSLATFTILLVSLVQGKVLILILTQHLLYVYISLAREGVIFIMFM